MKEFKPEEVVALVEASTELCALIKCLNLNNLKDVTQYDIGLLHRRTETVWALLPKFDT